jgi:outer membrane protein
MTALQRFEASKKTVMSTEKTYDFAQKRYQIGMLNIFDLTTSQNNLYQAKLEYNLNRFDYVFKMKVLEFYKGKGIKL